MDTQGKGEARPATGAILVVDDDAAVLDICRLLLKTLGFAVLSASGAMQGLDLYRERKSGIAAALIDLTMPSMGGVDLVRELRLINPDIKVVLMSGYCEHAIPSDFAAENIGGFLQKPFKIGDLRLKFEELLDSTHNKTTFEAAASPEILSTR
jgi:two-component system cell cycle sensor histidine kinase/response regulator CckA